MSRANKSQKRSEFIDLISESITHDEVLGTIDYKHKTEDQIKKFIHPHLVESLTNYIAENENKDKEVAEEYVKKNLKWKGNKTNAVSHILFMGTENRPDMVVDMNGLKIAIEFKKGKSGSDVRAGIGQSIIYSTHYDFVLYFFIDISDDKTIKNAQGGVNETEFVELLWEQYNIKFIVA